jgi:hypothetical protein
MIIGVLVAAVVGGLALGAAAAGLSPAAGQPGSPSPIAALPTPTATPTPPPTPSPTPEPTPTPVPPLPPTPTPEPPPARVPAPLTGEPVPARIASRHPIAVMIDDLGPARPQSGLHSADVVWHAPAEGGIPRYMAIFQTRLPTDLGPVRSARSYYVAWASEWKAIYAHSGGSPQALATLRAKGRGQYVYDANEFRWGGKYFHRIRSRPGPHNVYTDGKTLRSLGKKLKAKDKLLEPVWVFKPDAPKGARPYGGTIVVRYPANTVSYKYNRSTNTYRRSVSREGKQIDAADGERVEPKNVVVMVVSFTPIGDKKHRLEADLVGSGRAWISTNGRTVKGTWKKTATTKPTRFFDADGEPIPLTIGQTFIQVVPRASFASFEAGSDEPPPTEAPSPTPTP